MIKYIKKRIQELETRRDELHKKCLIFKTDGKIGDYFFTQLIAVETAIDELKECLKKNYYIIEVCIFINATESFDVKMDKSLDIDKFEDAVYLDFDISNLNLNECKDIIEKIIYKGQFDENYFFNFKKIDKVNVGETIIAYRVLKETLSVDEYDEWDLEDVTEEYKAVFGRTKLTENRKEIKEILKKFMDESEKILIDYGVQKKKTIEYETDLN